MNTARLIRLLLILFLGLGIAAIVTLWTIRQDESRREAQRPASQPAGVALPAGVSVGGSFQLTDHTGREVTEADYQGRYLLVFFGFTYCPDICPMELQVMAAALDALGPEAERVQPLFISVDPQRDTPDQMAEYVALFDSRITGLTGTPAQVAEVARAYRVYYARGPGDDQNYQVDHSTFTYLMGPDGQFLTVFPRGTDAEAMAAAMRRFMQGQG